MSLHFLVRSISIAMFLAIFAHVQKAFKQLSEGDAERYGRLAKIMASSGPLRFAVPIGFLGLAALAITLDIVTKG